MAYQKEGNQDSSSAVKKSRNPLKNLTGKAVFLDINSSGKLLGRVRECLGLIEVKFADCLSKDVDFVITNREKLPNQKLFSTPSSNNLECSNPGNEPFGGQRTSPSALNFLSRSNSVISQVNRAQTIMEKAKGYSNANDLLVTAKRLGIDVIHVSEIEKYVDKYIQYTRNLDENNRVNVSNDEKQAINENENTSQNVIKEVGKAFNNTQMQNSLSQASRKKSIEKLYASKTFKLKCPFLKVESICKQYKPIYQEFKKWHEIDFKNILNNHSPFQTYFSEDDKSSTSNFSSSRAEYDLDEKKPANNPDGELKQNPEFKSPTFNVSKLSASNLNSTNTKYRPKEKNNGDEPKIKKSSSISRNLKNGPNATNVDINSKKRIMNGYCECCKQRYDNLKQHLTSLQHENFGHNPANFKEIDKLVEGVLNFKQYLIKKGLAADEIKPTPAPTSAPALEVPKITISPSPSIRSEGGESEASKKRKLSSTSLGMAANRIKFRRSNIDFSSEMTSNISINGKIASSLNLTAGTEPTGIDDVVIAAFMNDFSYEVVQK